MRCGVRLEDARSSSRDGPTAAIASDNNQSDDSDAVDDDGDAGDDGQRQQWDSAGRGRASESDQRQASESEVW
jgi:hypothetical protein